MFSAVARHSAGHDNHLSVARLLLLEGFRQPATQEITKWMGYLSFPWTWALLSSKNTKVSHRWDVPFEQCVLRLCTRLFAVLSVHDELVYVQHCTTSVFQSAWCGRQKMCCDSQARQARNLFAAQKWRARWSDIGMTVFWLKWNSRTTLMHPQRTGSMPPNCINFFGAIWSL